MLNTTIIRTMEKPRLSIKVQTIAAIIAVIIAVIVPQIFHAIGAASGLGTAFGETFLPMHLPIILVGLFAGSYAGAISGFLSPLVSFAISGMPGLVMLPIMMLELCAYGFFAGLLCNIKMPVVVKVFITQVMGRMIRAAVTLVAVYALGNESIRIDSIWTSIANGVWGLALQLVLIPLIAYIVEERKKHEN